MAEPKTEVHPEISEAKEWLLSLLLAAPAFLPLVAHYVGFSRMGLFATGFINSDLPSYVANARELTDSGHLHLTYGNPFSFDYATPRIYFQPLTLLIAIATQVSRADPGIVFNFVGLVAAVVCVRLAISLFRCFAPHRASGELPSLLVFIWGGGVLTAMSLLFSFMQGQKAQGVFFLDPGSGWWFLNLGRNLVFPTEAAYHAIFFAVIVLILRRRFAGAFATLVLMSLSHPFTGLQLLGIVVAWSLLEIIVLRNKTVPISFVVACIALAFAHVAYYLLFLNSSPEHRSLQAQWMVPLFYPFSSFVFANFFVAAFAVWRMRSLARAKTVMQEWPNRLLLIWFVVTLILVNHDLFMRPVQPLHFSRGYDWIPLFLLGLPAIMAMFARLETVRPRAASALASAAVIAILLFDNAAWLGIRTAQALGIGEGHFALGNEPGDLLLPRGKSSLGFGLTQDQVKVFQTMNDPVNRGFVVVSSDPTLNYLLNVYTSLRSWSSHRVNTPDRMRRESELRDFFDSARVNSMWDHLPVLFVFRRDQPWAKRLSLLRTDSVTVMTNSSYVVVRRPRP